MNQNRHYLRRDVFRLLRLEERLTPSSYVSLVSRADPAAPQDTAGGISASARVSADGRFTTYTSTAENVVAGQFDANGAVDVFRKVKVPRTAVPGSLPVPPDV